jgi:hypothetical protein
MRQLDSTRYMYDSRGKIELKGTNVQIVTYSLTSQLDEDGRPKMFKDDDDSEYEYEQMIKRDKTKSKKSKEKLKGQSTQESIDSEVKPHSGIEHKHVEKNLRFNLNTQKIPHASLDETSSNKASSALHANTKDPSSDQEINREDSVSLRDSPPPPHHGPKQLKQTSKTCQLL